MTATKPITDDREDAELVAATCDGDTEAFAELFRRHRPATHRAAAAYTADQAEREDLVAETFARLFARIRTGRGPEGAVAPYLTRMLRNAAVDRWRLDRFVVPCERTPEREPHYDEDRLVAAEQASLVTRAFATLPRRWQEVLWFTEVDQESPARIAPLLGISPNAVAALAYRAREGLRQAYLRLHSCPDGDIACRTTRPRLGGWLRGGLSPQVDRQVRGHLDGCGPCRAVVGELADLNAEMAGRTERPSHHTGQGFLVRLSRRGNVRPARVPRATSSKAAGRGGRPPALVRGT